MMILLLPNCRVNIMSLGAVMASRRLLNGVTIASLSTNSGGALAIQTIKAVTSCGGSDRVGGSGARCWACRAIDDQIPQLVAIPPGYTMHARMPRGLPSAARAWVKPVKPNLEAQPW